MFSKYLPVGSVVQLKGREKKLFITGFARVADDSIKVYDYCGFPYPEGPNNPEKIECFDQSDIEKIYFLGYRDLEETKFKEKLREHLKGITKEIIED